MDEGATVPFCSHCGNELGERDFYCGRCGGRQPVAGTPGVYQRSDGLSPRAASMLCYVPFVGWIAAIFVLATDRFREQPDVRFHAFQGLYLFVAWLLVDWVLKPWFFPFFVSFPLGRILQLGVLVLWVVMLIKASREERYSLPLIGDLAQRSL